MNEFPQFPSIRMRRLRQSVGIRRLVQSTHLAASQLIYPIFVRDGQGERRPIGSMPGNDQWPLEQLERPLQMARDAGVGGVILFGIPATKDEVGSDACDDGGIVQRAVREAKRQCPELTVITDVCFCEYTSHGHCGELTERNGVVQVDNDRTLERLATQAITHARAGADMVAPSGMMDGMVGAIRRGLDGAGFSHLPIMSYAAKYASAYYGPFREAAESAPQFGDRRGYQMDPATDIGQALREVALDLQEGADIVMVKPALAYLDVIHAVSQQYPGVPVAAYNVSGEYSMVKAAAANGWID
ncbi:MAG: porphobilinogen synthase, partial [Planctomycetales bacterium]|nr:porphobilinogen synthase [Planctomycetales bacterium]